LDVFYRVLHNCHFFQDAVPAAGAQPCGRALHQDSETERFYKETLGLKAHPSKENWLLVNDTYAVHLMPPLADLSEDAAHSVDAARHFALQAGVRAAAHALHALM